MTTRSDATSNLSSSGSLSMATIEAGAVAMNVTFSRPIASSAARAENRSSSTARAPAMMVCIRQM